MAVNITSNIDIAKAQLAVNDSVNQALSNVDKTLSQNTSDKTQQSVNTSSNLSATTDNISKQVADLQNADLQQKIAKNIADTAASMNEQLNAMLSGMLQPIYDIIQNFKPIPDKIRNIVDVDGAANGMYAQMGKMQASIREFQQNNMISNEVPIELEDYLAAPLQYQNLLAIEYQKNEVTEEDCANSEYKKVQWELTEEYIQKLKDLFPAPQDRDVVGKAMEKAIGSAIKPAWQMVATPIQTIASIANIGPIPDMIQSIIDAVNGIVEIASKPIPEEMLNKMLAQKQLAQSKAEAEAAKSKEPDKGAFASMKDRLSKATSIATDTITQSYDGVTAGISESFANFEMPAIPDDIKEMIEDFKDAVIMVKNNISNIYIIILLKMMGAVFKCFNQIIGVIGVPSIPDPLGKIPQVLSDSVNIMQFIMGLPMSLVQCLTAIIKRKIKAVTIAMTPAPPLPVPEKVPVPPTSVEVVKPQTTWDDVKFTLTSEYDFSESDADDIIEKLQAFYDGSNEEVPVIYAIDSPVSTIKPGYFDELPIYGDHIKRFLMTPLYCQKTWIPENITGEVYEGTKSYELRPPIKVEDADMKYPFHKWTDNGVMKLNHDDEWSLLKQYHSKNSVFK